MKPQPLIAVRGVEQSSRWYQQLLDCKSDTEQGHPHRKEYDRIISDGSVVLGLHCWNAAPENAMDRLLADPDAAPHGHGALLSFLMDDFEAGVTRARGLAAETIADVFEVPNRSRSLLIRDPDGYVIALSSPPPRS